MQQALDEPGRLPERHAEQHLHRQTGLDRVRRENSPPDCFLILLTAIDRLPAPFTRRRSLPDHCGIKPALRRLQAIAYRPMDRQRAAALERIIMARPVPGLVGRGCRSAHAVQLPLDSQDKSLTRFVQQSPIELETRRKSGQRGLNPQIEDRP